MLTLTLDPRQDPGKGLNVRKQTATVGSRTVSSGRVLTMRLRLTCRADCVAVHLRIRDRFEDFITYILTPSRIRLRFIRFRGHLTEEKRVGMTRNYRGGGDRRWLAVLISLLIAVPILAQSLCLRVTHKQRRATVFFKKPVYCFATVVTTYRIQ